MRTCGFILFIFYGIQFPISALSQTRKIDSLKRQISLAFTASKKLDAIFALCEEKQSLNTDTLFYYASVAREMAMGSNNEARISLANYFISNCLVKKGRLDSALQMTDENLKTLSYSKNRIVYPKFSVQKGQIFIKTNKYKEALAEFYSLLNEAEQQQDTPVQVSIKTSIGWTNMEMGQNTEALNWFYRALNTSRNPSFFEYFGIIYSNIAATYNEIGRNDSAEYYINKAITSDRRSGNNLQFLANALAIQADIYIDTKRRSLAEAPLNEMLAIRKQIGEPFYIVSDMTQLAIYYANNDQPGKGIALCKEGIAMAEKFGLDSRLLILYDALAENYKSNGDYEKFAQTLQQIVSLKDSLYEKNSAEALAGLQAKYNLQKKENIIIQQELDLTKKNYLFYSSILLSVIILAAAVVLFRNYRKRQHMKMEGMLENEKRNAADAIKKAEEKERIRIAADLHDNLGSYAASMASNLDYIQIREMNSENNDVYRELRNNSLSIISQLNDTIWVLKKDALSLTAISDRIKVFISRIQPSYPGIGIDVDEGIDHDYLLSSSQAFHLYRVIQEAINNALKHSKGSKIVLKIIADTGTWMVTVIDNGRWMAGWHDNIAGGNGLVNMKNRSAEAGWSINWIANGSGGTSVTISPTTN